MYWLSFWHPFETPGIDPMEICFMLVYLKFIKNLLQELKCLGSTQWFVFLKDLTGSLNKPFTASWREIKLPKSIW